MGLMGPMRPMGLILWQQLRRFQNLLRPRAHPIILSEVAPTNDAARINQEFGRARYVMPVLALALMNQIVRANRFQIGIGQDREGVTGFLRQVARDFGVINADRHRSNPNFMKERQLLLDTPQLGVAGDSPVASIKNQQSAFGGFAIDGLRT